MNEEALQAAVEFLDSWLAYRSRQTDIPGFSVAIYNKDAVAFSRAYGLADIERGWRLTTRHLFGVASQTKMFTATAILQLVEADKLRLDDFASHYLPWLLGHRDKRVQEITVHNLLSHSAGLIRDGADTDYWELARPFPSAEGFRQMVLATNITHDPNTRLKYSNLGYGLLGQIIEAASGQTWTDYIAKHIINPLKLRSTFADYAPALDGRLATAYGVPFEHKRPALMPRRTTGALAAAVGVHATAEDMCRFAAAHFFGNDTLISDRLKREMQRSQWVQSRGYDSGSEFGLGLEIMHIGERRVVGHSGHLSGFLTATYFDPHASLAVSVMANCKDAPSAQIARGIFEALDWFGESAAEPTPLHIARLNVRLLSALGSVQVVAAESRLVAIDPDDWEPLTWGEDLKRLDDHTLQVITPGSIFNEGELLQYTFAKDAVQSVRYAGGTLLPEARYRRNFKHKK